MDKYNYFNAVCDDVREAIKNDYAERFGEFETLEELENKLNDDLWTDDGVTGNASGSYTFSTWGAEECLCHNLEELAEACEEFGISAAVELAKGAEACDVLLRCYYLAQAIAEVLPEFKDEFDEAHENGAEAEE